MPIYEYACACGNTFEALIIRSSDASDVQCPACQSTQVERVMSATVNVDPRVHDYLRPSSKKIRVKQ